MKLFQSFVILTFTLFFINCESPSEQQKEIPDVLNGYKETTLPIIMKGCFGNTYHLPLLKEDSLANGLINNEIPYCTFKTNGDYYAIIRLAAADCYIPFLTTYDKNGKVIDETDIAIGYCGSGPGFRCEEYAIIKSDFSIYTSDTISEVEIDSLGEEISSTKQTYVLYKKGKLLSSGKIELTDTIRQILKN